MFPAIIAALPAIAGAIGSAAPAASAIGGAISAAAPAAATALGSGGLGAALGTLGTGAASGFGSALGAGGLGATLGSLGSSVGQGAIGSAINSAVNGTVSPFAGSAIQSAANNFIMSPTSTAGSALSSLSNTFNKAKPLLNAGGSIYNTISGNKAQQQAQAAQAGQAHLSGTMQDANNGNGGGIQVDTSPIREQLSIQQPSNFSYSALKPLMKQNLSTDLYNGGSNPYQMALSNYFGA